MKKVMLVFSTFLEAIKMCPLVNELKPRNEQQTVVWQMLDILTEYTEAGITNDIRFLTEHMDEWGSIGERAINLYGNSYSWGIMDDRIDQLYRTLSTKIQCAAT